MHCLGLFFTNVDVEHLFQKVTNLHDFRSNVTDFTCMALQRTFGKISEVSARKGKFRYQYREFSLMCHSLAHNMRENCRYFYSHSAVKVQQPMFGGVHGGVRLPQRPMCRGWN